eukprot:COSAG01_NODE_3354_length_6215_cov_299.344016_6_plen_214_part_00
MIGNISPSSQQQQKKGVRDGVGRRVFWLQLFWVPTRRPGCWLGGWEECCPPCLLGMGAWRSLRSWLGGVLLFAVLLVGLRNWLRDPWDHHHHHQQHPAHHAGAARNRGRTGAVEPPTGRQALAHHPQGFYRPHHHQHDQLQAPCPAGSWLNVQSGICTLLTRCNATTEVVVAAPTLTSDRTCPQLYPPSPMPARHSDDVRSAAKAATASACTR